MPWHDHDAVARNIAFNTIIALKERENWDIEDVKRFLRHTMICESVWGLMNKEIEYFVNLVFEEPRVVARLRGINFYDIYTDEWGSEVFHIIFPAVQDLDEAGNLVAST